MELEQPTLYDDNLHPQDRESLRKLHSMGFTPGDAARVPGRNGREYYVHLEAGILHIDSDSVSAVRPTGCRVEIAYNGMDSVPIGEAFEYLHNEYEPDVELRCPICRATYPAEADESCDCPISGIQDTTDWPTIPQRSPRKVANGTAIAVESPPE